MVSSNFDIRFRHYSFSLYLHINYSNLLLTSFSSFKIVVVAIITIIVFLWIKSAMHDLDSNGNIYIGVLFYGNMLIMLNLLNLP